MHTRRRRRRCAGFAVDGQPSAAAAVAAPWQRAPTEHDRNREDVQNPYRTNSFALPPALRDDDLPVEPELVTPVLAVERPEDVLFVGLHDAVDFATLPC